MALQLDSAQDERGKRTALFSSINEAFSMCAWVYHTNVDNLNGSADTYSTIGGMEGAITVNFHDTGSGSAGNTKFSIGTAGNDFDGSLVSSNTWYHVGLTATAGAGARTFFAYLNGVQDATGSETLTGDIDFNISAYNSGNTTDQWDGRMAAMKVWTGAVLTAAEIAAEMRQYLPLRVTNLRAFYPMLGSVVGDFNVDHSGNGQTLTWTTTGALTFVDGPPIPWVQGRQRRVHKAVTSSAALTGTAAGGMTEADVVAGSKTIIVTITGDTVIAN